MQSALSSEGVCEWEPAAAPSTLPPSTAPAARACGKQRGQRKGQGQRNASSRGRQQKCREQGRGLRVALQPKLTAVGAAAAMPSASVNMCFSADPATPAMLGRLTQHLRAACLHDACCIMWRQWLLSAYRCTLWLVNVRYIYIYIYQWPPAHHPLKLTTLRIPSSQCNLSITVD